MQENIRYLRSQKASAKDIEAEIARWQPIIARYNAEEQAQAEREEKLGSVGTRVATALTQPLRALPGGEAVMAGARSLARRQPYSEALEDIRAAQESVDPTAAAIVRGATGMAMLGPVGSRLATAKTALGGIAQAAGVGAGISAAEQGLSAEPMSARERLGRALEGAKSGAITGIATAGLARGIMGARDLERAMRVPSRGAQQLAAERALQAQTGPMYAAAEQAGKAAQGPVQAFGQPGIREYVDDILSSPSFRQKNPNPSQQDVIKAVREHILDTQMAAEKAAAAQAATGGQRVAAATKLRKADAELLAKQLLDESDYFSQGLYRQAVTATAKGKATQRAAQEAGEAVRTTANRQWVSGQKLASESPEAFARDVGRMSPEEVRAALPGAYAGLRESMRLSYNPLAGFGLPQSATKLLLARNTLEPLEQAAVAGRTGIGASYQRMRAPSLRNYLLGAGYGVREEE